MEEMNEKTLSTLCFLLALALLASFVLPGTNHHPGSILGGLAFLFASYILRLIGREKTA